MEKKQHPSYGMIRFARSSIGGSGTALFGSSIMHNNVIRLSISKGMMEREGNEDWFLAGTDINDMIVEVEMSYTQFAEAITSLNIGEGIPVTITKVNGTFVEPCPYSDRQKVMRREVDEATRDLVRQLEKRSEEIEKLLDEKRVSKALSVGIKEMIAKGLISNPLRDHMKGRIDYCVLEILKQISCVLVNTITMSDALAKVPEVLNFTEEKIIDILSDNHKVLGFFANNDLEEVKRKGEAIFSAITTSNVYQVEWAVLVLELIDWVRRYQYLISDRAKNILYSTVLEPVPYLNVVAGRELNPDNPNNSCLLLKKMGTDSGKVLYAGTMVKIDKRSLVSLWYINDAAIEKFAKCLVDAINMAKKWLDKTEGEFILDPDYYGVI